MPAGARGGCEGVGQTEAINKGIVLALGGGGERVRGGIVGVDGCVHTMPSGRPPPPRGKGGSRHMLVHTTGRAWGGSACAEAAGLGEGAGAHTRCRHMAALEAGSATATPCGLGRASRMGLRRGRSSDGGLGAA
jgi:hypothetical protein